MPNTVLTGSVRVGSVRRHQQGSIARLSVFAQLAPCAAKQVHLHCKALSPKLPGRVQRLGFPSGRAFHDCVESWVVVQPVLPFQGGKQPVHLKRETGGGKVAAEVDQEVVIASTPEDG